MKIKHLAIISGILFILSIFVIISSSLNASRLNNTIRELDDRRFISYLLAEELKESSRSLTNAIRKYVVTGIEDYANEFYKTLKIRSGEIERPSYRFISPGQKISLFYLMENAGYSERELELLSLSAMLSEALVEIEVEAMNAVRGLFPDENGFYSIIGEPDRVRATELIFSPAYDQAVESIMEPILEFNYELNERFLSEFELLQNDITRSQVSLWSAIILNITLFIVFLFVGWRFLVQLKVLREVTQERRIAEETALAANRLKTEFLAVMSHEIRTPMNSIMGFAELAIYTDIPPQTKGYLKNIIESTRWLLHIINDVLDISKIESGKMELENVPFDLTEVFNRCQSVIRPSVAEKGLELRLYVEPPAGKKLLGDQIRLYQVIENLLSNAVKFTESGIIGFSALTKNVSETSATIYFEVKDTGIGMTTEQVEKVFEPFVQADSSTTRNFGGTGLGLSITKNIVELMGGTLVLESKVNLGSKFSFEITFEVIDDTQVIHDQHKLQLLEKPYFDALILICDDNHLNQQVICEHLLQVGIKTVVANNGEEGVRKVRERIENNEPRFDMIFMDIFMPVMDGMDAATKIKEFDKETPIVAVTANVMASELDKYRKKGMLDCLSKPFTTYELWSLLLKYLIPVSISQIKDNVDHVEDILNDKIKTELSNDLSDLYERISNALNKDFEEAHRLAHNLKTHAIMLEKAELKSIASEVEILVKNKEPIPQDKLNQLEHEIKITKQFLDDLL